MSASNSNKKKWVKTYVPIVITDEMRERIPYLEQIEVDPITKQASVRNVAYLAAIATNTLDWNKLSHTQLVKAIESYHYLSLDATELVKRFLWIIGESKAVCSKYIIFTHNDVVFPSFKNMSPVLYQELNLLRKKCSNNPLAFSFRSNLRCQIREHVCVQNIINALIYESTILLDYFRHDSKSQHQKFFDRQHQQLLINEIIFSDAVISLRWLLAQSCFSMDSNLSYIESALSSAFLDGRKCEKCTSYLLTLQNPTFKITSAGFSNAILAKISIDTLMIWANQVEITSNQLISAARIEEHTCILFQRLWRIIKPNFIHSYELLKSLAGTSNGSFAFLLPEIPSVHNNQLAAYLIEKNFITNLKVLLEQRPSIQPALCWIPIAMYHTRYYEDCYQMLDYLHSIHTPVNQDTFRYAARYCKLESMIYLRENRSCPWDVRAFFGAISSDSDKYQKLAYLFANGCPIPREVDQNDDENDIDGDDYYDEEYMNWYHPELIQ